jgi:hypothetical protein
MGAKRNAYAVLVIKAERNKSLGREIGWAIVDWIHLVQDRNQ